MGNTRSVHAAPTEGPSDIATLVHSPSEIVEARKLQGDQAQRLVNLLDQHLASPRLDEKVFRRSSQLLYKICKARGMLPASCVVQPGHIHVGEFGWRGGFADVSKGRYRGRTVAIKHLRTVTGDEFDKVFKELCREVLIWKRLSHPNILPLLGVSVSKNPLYFRIISEWMPNGNVMEYVRSNPQANRLLLLSEVVCGASYLHELGVAHGDLKGTNILIDHTGTARLGDFGLMTMTDLSVILFSNTAIPSCGTTRWMSPELLDPSRFHSGGFPSRESDCYALGMVVYEVLSGLVPFHHLRSPVVPFAILRGERPEEPQNASSLGFTPTLWGLVQSCWNETSSERPTAQQLFDYLHLSSTTWTPPSPPDTTTTGRVLATPTPGTSGVSGVPLSSSTCRVQ